MNNVKVSLLLMISWMVMGGSFCKADSIFALEDYPAATDDIANNISVYGQRIVNKTFDIQLRESVKPIPLFSLQFGGEYYQAGMLNDPTHVQTRAKCVAERLAHAWTLMDHGATLEVGYDTWDDYHLKAVLSPMKRVAIFIQSPLRKYDPLRIMTIYPEDVAATPWISSEQSLAQYLRDLMEAHYLLFWKKESDLFKYEALRIDSTREGKIFKEVAVRALEVAKLKGQGTFDDGILKDAIARLPLSQREQLYRLATTPPIDWESSQSK